MHEQSLVTDFSVPRFTKLLWLQPFNTVSICSLVSDFYVTSLTKCISLEGDSNMENCRFIMYFAVEHACKTFNCLPTLQKGVITHEFTTWYHETDPYYYAMFIICLFLKCHIYWN